jgi:dTMP kinase
MLLEWNRVATGGLKPALTLLYDLDPELGLSRRAVAAGEMNRLDRESREFHARVRARYLELAAAEPVRFKVLDATQDPDTLEALAWGVLEQRLEEAHIPGVG